MEKENWKDIIDNAGYVRKKAGLVLYLWYKRKLPFVSNFYSVTVEYYENKTINELLEIANN